MENVITTIFEIESEGYQALSEMRQNAVTAAYTVAEAALIRRDAGGVHVLDGFDTGARTGDDTAAGMLVGSLVGILGGSLGVLLGAGTGMLLGGTVDAADAVDDASMVEIIAGKLFDGEIAIVALVQEDFEPAFDVAVQRFATTVIRQDAAEVAAEVERARDLEAEMERQARERLRAERKAERAGRVEGAKDSIRARFDAIRADAADRKATREAEREARRDERDAARRAAFDGAVEDLRGRVEAAEAERVQRKADAAAERLGRGSAYLEETGTKEN